MRIEESDSELELIQDELNLNPVKAAFTETIETIDVGIEKPVGVTKRVSVAWLCFDKEKVIKKNGLEYLKCNQPNCGVTYQVVEGTATSMARHVKKMHKNLLPEITWRKVNK